MGSEHHGVNKKLQQISTDLIYINPHYTEFPYTLVDSLNVSVACVITLKIIKDKMKLKQWNMVY